MKGEFIVFSILRCGISAYLCISAVDLHLRLGSPQRRRVTQRHAEGFFKDECSLSPNRLHSLRLTTNRGLRHLRCYPEDAPDTAIELKRLLSSVQVVARHSSGATGTIRWNHFIVRR